MKNNDRINDAVGEVIRIARAYAMENTSAAIEPSHIFKALLHKESGLVPFVEKSLAQDYYYLLDWADRKAPGPGPTCSSPLPPSR